MLKLLVSLLSVAASLLLGSVLAWALLLGICSIPGLSYSVACGHNAYIWLPVVVPLGVFLAWRFVRRIKHKIIPSRPKELPRANDA